MLRQALILTSFREYAQAMRAALLTLGDSNTRVDVELDALRAMQLVPQQYDLILLDTMLDAMDGMQLLLLMKQQASTPTFVIVSDVPDETSRAQAYQNGADFFLERPRTAEGLRIALDAIRGLLKRHFESQPLHVDLEGPLQSLGDIVQTRCLSGDSVLLMVRSAHQSGDIFIFRGEVYHAQYPGKGGEAAFTDMMHWDNGQVRIKVLKLPNVPPRTIETPYRTLLADAKKSGALDADLRTRTGELRIVPDEILAEEELPYVVQEAPPRNEEETPSPDLTKTADLAVAGETILPTINSHWKINLMGELVEGSQMAEPARCAFITYFIYRKLADVAVTLEVDYFNQLTLIGPHLQQVLMADNLGVRHGVFDSAWTREDARLQYVKWCCEQSL